MSESKPFVLFVQGHRNGVDHYRITQPGLKLMERENFYIGLSKMMDEDEMAFWIDKADIIFTHTTSEKFYHFMKERKHGQKIVIDEDDDLFSVSPFNPGYSSYGIKEVDYILADGTKRKLRDGDSGFDIEANKKRLYFYVKCLEEADAVTVPSSVLCGMIKRFNKNVHVIKNLLDMKVWNPLLIEKDLKEVRIGYQCGWSHMEDWWEVRDVLLTLMNKYPQVKLVIFGQSYEGSLKEFPQDRIERHGWVQMDAYPWKLKCLNFDIGIAPLYNNEFATAKSEIKWEEYSALRIPSVCSNIPPYTLSVEDGKTGFLCSDSKDWQDTLETLITNAEYRKHIGKQAMKKVMEKYDLDKEIVLYEDLFDRLLKQKLVLV